MTMMMMTFSKIPVTITPGFTEFTRIPLGATFVMVMLMVTAMAIGTVMMTISPMLIEFTPHNANHGRSKVPIVNNSRTCSISFATFFKNEVKNTTTTCFIPFATFFKTRPMPKPQELNSELVDPWQPSTSCKPVLQDKPCASFQFDKFDIGFLYTRIGPVHLFRLTNLT